MPAARTHDRAQVATIALEAIDLGLPVIPTIMAVLDCTNNQARYLSRLVRLAGLLGQAPHHPARATIHRGSRTEHTWTVCQDCKITWPCPHAYPDRTEEGPEPDERARGRHRRPQRPAGGRA